MVFVADDQCCYSHWTLFIHIFFFSFLFLSFVLSFLFFIFLGGIKSADWIAMVDVFETGIRRFFPPVDLLAFHVGNGWG